MWEGLALVVIVGGALLWADSLKARERAVKAGRSACERYQLQFLDDTVSFARMRLGRDEDGQSPMEATFPSDGRWGVSLVVGDASGSGKPTADEAPSTLVEVDTKKPVVESLELRERKNGLQLNWKATDANLVEDSVRLFYSHDPSGPWETIAVQQAGEGGYLWKNAAEAMSRPLYFRVDATDRAGNIGSLATPKEDG